MEKVESALDVLSRAATMVQPCAAYPASDTESFARSSCSDIQVLSMEPPRSPKFNMPLWQPWMSASQKESPSTASSGESEGDRTPETPEQPKELTGKWRRERRTRIPDYRPRENGKMALRSQSFNERRTAPVTRTHAHTHTHSDGELSDETDDVGRAPPQYPGAKAEAPIDMRLRARPPPYRPSVIKTNDAPPGSLSMCDPVIDEHFRRSLGDNYMNLFKKDAGPKRTTKDRATSPIFNTDRPTNAVQHMDVDDASVSVDDHFAKALGDTWRQIQTSRTKARPDQTGPDQTQGVDDHFTKALGDTWKNIQTKHKMDENKPKDQTKIITRSGVVI